MPARYTFLLDGGISEKKKEIQQIFPFIKNEKTLTHHTPSPRKHYNTITHITSTLLRNNMQDIHFHGEKTENKHFLIQNM